MNYKSILSILKKDFLENKWLWGLLGLHSVVSAVGVFGPQDLIGMIEVYWFWGLLPIISTQFHHEDSSKATQLKLNYLRAFVVFSPALALGSVMPLLGLFDLQHFNIVTWIFYYLGLVTTIGLLIQWKVWASLNWEKIFQLNWSLKDPTIWSEIVGIAILCLVFELAWEGLVYKESQAMLTPTQVDSFLRTIHFSEAFFAGSFLALYLWVSRSIRQ